ncbi:MAG: hypothetical protein MUP82_02280 [Candidatus Marinimicrobia bacterium]|nr:hypothetical protein [Candidatus Neomarinimicrobiota bacterium]
MAACNRSGNKWTVNELLALQREYELLELSVQQIAVKHQRSVSAVLFRLESEGFIDSWNSARGFDILEYQKMTRGDDNYDAQCCAEDDDDDDEDDDDDDEEYVDEASDYEDDSVISDRVWNLEASVREISYMVTQMFNKMIPSQETSRTY